MLSILVPKIPNLFNVHERREVAWDAKSIELRHPIYRTVTRTGETARDEAGGFDRNF